MLIIVLMGAAVLYLVLYIVWTLAQPQITGTAHGLMAALAEATLWPQNTVFLILRGLILATLLYIVSDYLLSTTKRGLASARRKREGSKPRQGRIARTGHIAFLRPQIARDQDEWQASIESSLNTRS